MKTFCFILAAALLMSACNNAASNREITGFGDSVARDIGAPDSVKLIKSGALEFKVRDVLKSVHAVSAMAKGIGGMIMHQNIASEINESKEVRLSEDSLMTISSYTIRSEITVRIPQANLESFVDSITGLAAFIINSTMDIQDKSLAYLSARLREENRADVIAGARGTRSKKEDLDFLINKKDEMISEAVANRQIDEDVRLSTVQLNLYQDPVVKKEITANYRTSDYQLPFGSRLSDALRGGWSAFLDFVIALSYLWVFIIGGLGLLLAYRYYKKKRPSLLQS